MNCTAANKLYVRADGSVPCNCDVGENVTLFRPDRGDLDGFDYVRDCYNGKPFRLLRERFASGEPFIGACQDCYYFDPDAEFEHGGDHWTLRELETVQIESSFLCPIQCEACVPKKTRTDAQLSPLGKGPYELPDELFRKLVDDLTRHGLTVQEIFFCGRGEPLLHKRFGELVRYARERLPGAYFSTHTSGNVRFFPGVLELDHVTVSIDGASQESFATYRVDGELERCLEFLRNLLRARRAPSRRFSWRRFRPLVRVPDRSLRHLIKLPRRILRYVLKRRPTIPLLPVVQWKYILFEHNDSPEEIAEAQRMAMELGVDEMQFVLSHTSNRSKRYTSTDQIERDPLFSQFSRARALGSTVNDAVDNITLWEDEAHRIAGR